MSLKQIVEALVFASQKPLMPQEIVAALRGAAEDSDDLDAAAFAKTKESEVAAVLEQSKIEGIEATRGFQLVEEVNGWHFATDPAFARWVRQLYPEAKPARLSGPALETLAIISYRQPITRADIEAVRGVAVDGMVTMLLEKQLIRIAGRAEVPGRPLLYETTQFFLEHFGLKNLDELPNATELRRVNLPTAPSPETKKSPEQLPLVEVAIAGDEPPAEPAQETAHASDAFPSQHSETVIE
ncbi:MAG: segregation and condensation protein [Chthoniobacter sp.]|nr:segregation and condensation protein [Chthoniobacter sp.]